MKVIYKYKLVGRNTVLSLPKGALVLHADWQRGEPQLWALVTPGEETEERKFLFIGTGHDIQETKLQHVSSFLIHGGEFVFHVLEVLA